LEGDKLYLLPVQGSDTQWYKNVLNNPMIRIDARGAEAEVKVVPVTDPTQVSSVVEKFRAKYGAKRRQEVLFKARRCRPRSDALIVRDRNTGASVHVYISKFAPPRVISAYFANNPWLWL